MLWMFHIGLRIIHMTLFRTMDRSSYQDYLHNIKELWHFSSTKHMLNNVTVFVLDMIRNGIHITNILILKFLLPIYQMINISDDPWMTLLLKFETEPNSRYLRDQLPRRMYIRDPHQTRQWWVPNGNRNRTRQSSCPHYGFLWSPGSLVGALLNNVKLFELHKNNWLQLPRTFALIGSADSVRKFICVLYALSRLWWYVSIRTLHLLFP